MYDWMETTGGPHLLVPEALLPLWRGVEGWSDHEDPDDHSDYARACRVESWLGAVEIGQGSGLIFGGEVGPVTWIADSDGKGGYFVQALGIDSEADICPALASEELANAFKMEPADRLTFKVPPAGTLRLIDAGDMGNDLVIPGLSLSLKPGNYLFSATYLETPSLMMVVRKVVALS